MMESHAGKKVRWDAEQRPDVKKQARGENQRYIQKGRKKPEEKNETNTKAKYPKNYERLISIVILFILHMNVQLKHILFPEYRMRING